MIKNIELIFDRSEFNSDLSPKLVSFCLNLLEPKFNTVLLLIVMDNWKECWR